MTAQLRDLARRYIRSARAKALSHEARLVLLGCAEDIEFVLRSNGASTVALRRSLERTRRQIA